MLMKNYGQKSERMREHIDIFYSHEAQLFQFSVQCDSPIYLNRFLCLLELAWLHFYLFLKISLTNIDTPLFVSTTAFRFCKYTCKWSRAFSIPIYASEKSNQNQLWNFSLTTPEKIIFLFTPKTKDQYLSFWSFRQ